MTEHELPGDAAQADDSSTPAPNPADAAPAVAAPPVVTHAWAGGSPDGAAHREVAQDEHGRIAEQVDCRGCGYNLQGLPTAGLCPECSTPVERSIRGDLLQFANPEWLARVRRGLLWVIIGIFAQFGIGMLGGLGVTLGMSMTANQTGAVNFSMMGVGIVALFSLAAAAILVLGVWWMTTPDPATIEQEPMISARRMARFCMFFVFAQGITQMFANPGAMMMTAGGATGAVPGVVRTMLVIGVIGMALQSVALVGQVAGLVYLRSFALRIPKPSLAKQTRIVAWGYGIANGFGLLVGITMIAMMPALLGGLTAAGGGPPPNALLSILIVAGVGGCVFGTANAVFSIWALVLLFLYRSGIAKVETLAVAHWHDGSAGGATSPLPA